MRRIALLLAALAGTACAGMAPGDNPVQAAEGHFATVGPEPVGQVYFERDSVALDAIDIAVITRQTESLRDDPTLVVGLRGYVDDMSSTAYGLAIGQKRLNAVRIALLSAGISPRRIKTEIHAGDLATGSTCEDDDCRKQWRRVDIFLRR